MATTRVRDTSTLRRSRFLARLIIRAFGNAPRSLSGARNPWTTFFDANLSKQFKLKGEELALELRADFINVLNHPNFFINPNNAHDYGNGFNRGSLSDPNAAPFIIRTDFGKFERANTTSVRLMRFGARLVF